MVRAALADWSALGLPGTEQLTEHLTADALVVVSELVTNAVVHAGTDVEVGFQVEGTGALVVEVTDQHPSRAPGSAAPETPHDAAEYGRGLRLVAALAEAWGITYRPGTKTVWARLSAVGTDDAGQSEPYAGGCGARRTPGSPGIWRPGEAPDGADTTDSAAGEDTGADETGKAVQPGGVGQGDQGDQGGRGEKGGQGGQCGRVDDGDRCGHGGQDGPDGSGAPHGPDAEGPERSDSPASGSDRRTAAVGGVADVEAEGLGRSEGSGRGAAALGRVVDVEGEGLGRSEGSGGREAALGGAVDVEGEGLGRSEVPGCREAALGGAVDADAEGIGRSEGSGRGAAALGRAVGADAGPGVGPYADASRGRGGCSGRSDPAGWRAPWDGVTGTARRGIRDREWLGRGALSFLAEASDLLAGQLDEDLVASLTGQLIVPRLADWCGVWLEDESLGRGAWTDDTGAAVGARLARVWHSGEGRLDELRAALEKDPPRPRDPWRSGPVGHPWPGDALGPDGTHGTALAYRLVAGGRPLGTLVIGRADTPGAVGTPGAPGTTGFPDEITGLVEDLSRRVALAIGAARQYARQATISAVLQRGLLPGAVAEIPGVRSALVYEPRDKGGPSGDFYDLFPAGDGRWCFAVGDVQGKGPEAAVVIGLARPWLRLLAREQYGVPDVLDRLNQLLLDDATEAADAAARALVAAGGPPVAPGDGPQTRFLSLLYGELVPFDGGVRCTLASAGHPLPLLLGPDGTVSAVACPQTLLGVVEDATYVSETFELRSGDTLLCVTDGITERRSGSRQFDDGDGLAAALAGCAGLDAELVAERIRRLVHEFGPRPPEDDLALLVLQAD
ncbi:SpoIIE family protein phosphatase [Streptomyces sp. NPDC059906]|uniref:SpoIIE family protein phosphatase n=1 Tax=Streptomyces sp. NPDC059906 TaxID=3346997 RepID=UPI003653CB00